MQFKQVGIILKDKLCPIPGNAADFVVGIETDVQDYHFIYRSLIVDKSVAIWPLCTLPYNLCIVFNSSPTYVRIAYITFPKWVGEVFRKDNFWRLSERFVMKGGDVFMDSKHILDKCIGSYLFRYK